MGGGEYRGFLNPRTLNIADRYGRGGNARGEGLRVPVSARLRGLSPGEYQACLLYTSPSPRDRG